MFNLQEFINEIIIDLKRLFKDNNLHISSQVHEEGVTVNVSHKDKNTVKTINFPFDTKPNFILVHSRIYDAVMELKDA